MTASMASRSIRAVSMASASWCSAALQVLQQAGRDDERAADDHRRQGGDLPLQLEVGQPLLEARLQLVGALPRLRRVEPRRAAGLLLGLQLLGPVVPVVDLLGQAVLHRGLRLVDELLAALADLRRGAAGTRRPIACSTGTRLEVLLQPGVFEELRDERPLRLLQRAVVEVRGPAGQAHLAVAVGLDELDLPRDATRRWPCVSSRPSVIACSR